jgi:hypothetical protein
MKHDWKHISDNGYYHDFKCLNCDMLSFAFTNFLYIKYTYDIAKYSNIDNNDERLSVDNITCEEVIIKNIIE